MAPKGRPRHDDGMPRPLALNHLNLPAPDPEAQRRWYVEKLGFVARGRFLWSAGTLLVFVDGEAIASDDSHVGFRVDSLSELSAWVETLAGRGVDTGPIEGDETYSRVLFRDPVGYQIELFYEPLPA